MLFFFRPKKTAARKGKKVSKFQPAAASKCCFFHSSGFRKHPKASLINQIDALQSINQQLIKQQSINQQSINHQSIHQQSIHQQSTK